MGEGRKERAHPSLGVVCHGLALGASLHHLLHPFHRPVLCVDDGPPEALGAADALGGHVACARLAKGFKPSAQTKQIAAAMSSELSDGFR